MTGITRFRLPDPDRDGRRAGSFAARPSLRTPPPAIAAVVAQAKRYFAGERIDFTPIDLDLAQRRSVPPRDLRGAAQGRLRRDRHLRRACQARGRERAASRAGRRRRDGAQSGAADHSVPPRARGRRQARRLLGAGPHRGEGAHARARRRVHRRAAAAVCNGAAATAQGHCGTRPDSHIAARSFALVRAHHNSREKKQWPRLRSSRVRARAWGARRRWR